MYYFAPDSLVHSDVWSDRNKLQYLRGIISKKLEIDREIEMFALQDWGPDRSVVLARYNPEMGGIVNSRPMSIISAQKGSWAPIISIADRLKDPYLKNGLPTLLFGNNWQRIGNFLLTPKSERSPITGYWDDIYGACGAACLAARFSEQNIMIDFNGEALDARVDTYPQDLADSYFSR